MDWEIVGPMAVAVVFILTVGGVLLLRPIATRLGSLLEAMAKERQVDKSDDMYRLREEVETLRSRLELLEDRQDFTEGLIDRGGAGGRERLGK